MTPRELAEALGGAVFKSGQWYALCPAHDDTEPSLAITTGEDGQRIIVKCRAGCAQDRIIQILAAQGLDVRDPAKPREPKRPRKIVATYDYCDEHGVMRYQAIRTDPKGFWQRAPDGKGGWLKKPDRTGKMRLTMDGIEPLPYRLPELLRQPHAPVLIVEGEKHVDALMAGGFLATCNHGGTAGTDRWPTIASWLAGRQVTILPDNDTPGQVHALGVASALSGIAASVSFLDLPGLPPKGDVINWMEAGGTPEKLVELLMVAAMPFESQKQHTNGHLKAENNPWERAKEICRRYVFVKDINAFWDRETRHLYKLEAIRHAHWSEMPPTDKGVPTDPQDVLIKGQHVGGDKGCVDKVDRIGFLPGETAEIFDEDGGKSLNIWIKPDILPIKGDVTPFLDHIKYLVDQEQFAADYLLDYFAHLIQFPEKKIKSTILMIGQPGIGKSFISETILTPLLGSQNTTSVETQELDSQFNDYMDGVQLVTVHELMTIDSRPTMNKLKSYITDQWLRINRKNIPAYKYRNRTNFLLFSNFEDAARIEKSDRRYFVWISKAERREPAYYTGLAHWFDREGGANHTLAYLQSRDLSAFDANAAPPDTAAKRRIIEDSRSPVLAYLQEAFDAAERPFNHDLVSLNDVIDYYAAQRTNYRITHKVLGSFLRGMGGLDLGPKRLNSARKRLWAIRNAPEWEQLSETELAIWFREIQIAPLSEADKTIALGRMRVV